jgi:cytidylate kinase
MPIITISRGSYSKGKAVAEAVAQRLGYECLSRDILLEASEEFNVPEIRLIRAIHDAPGILDRLSHKKERYVAYVQTALLKHLRRDNIVYHGLAGHFFVDEIHHVLKVRIIADMEERVKLEMGRVGVSESEALHLLEQDDGERRKWSQYLYGVDTSEPSLYDLLIHIHKVTVDDATDIICRTSGLEHFQATPESKQEVEDLLLTAEIRTALIGMDHRLDVCAKDGVVFVKSRATPQQQPSLIHEIEKAVSEVPGVRDIKVTVEPILPLSE